MNLWEPFQEAVTLRDAMDRLLQESFVRTGRATTNGNGGGYLVPPADAWESEDEVHIEMALPGVDTESVDVTFEQNSLTVRGQFEAPAEDKTWVLRERARGRFQRTFNLGVAVEGDKAEASFRNGVLTLRLPKSEAIKPRKIQVTTA
jgi:HSP20 family protein